MSFDVSWVYQIVDKYSAPIRKITKATATARSGINKASHALKKMSDKMAGIKGAVGSVAGIAAIVFPTKKAIDFESIMTDVKKVVSFKTPDMFNKFREGIFKTAVALGKTPKAIAEIAVEGGKLGILPKKMQEFIDLTARTSIAFDMVERVAGNAIGSIKTKLGLTVKETGGMMDAINFLADGLSTTGKDVVQVVARTVGEMKTIKMPPELVAGWAAFAAQVAVTPELAASGLNMMIRRMVKIPSLEKKLLRDPSGAIKKYLSKYQFKSGKIKIKKLYKFFGDEAGAFVVKVLGSQKLLDKTLGMVGKGSKFAGSMQRELVAKMATTATAIGKIKAVADVAFIQMGDAILPIIKNLTPGIVKALSKFRDFVKLHPGLTKIGIAILGITVAVTALSVIIGLMASGFSAVAAIAAAVLSPIVGIIALIAAAVAGVVGGFVYLYQNSEKVRTAVGRLGAAFKPVFELIGKLISWVLNIFSGLWAGIGGGNAIFEFFETVAVGAINFITAAIQALIFDIKFVWNWVGSLINRFTAFGKKSGIFDIISGVISIAIKWLESLWNWVGSLIVKFTEFGGMSRVFDVILEGINILINGLQSVWNFAKDVWNTFIFLGEETETFSAISEGINSAIKGLESLWNWAENVLNKFTSFMEKSGMFDAFSTGVNKLITGLESLWDWAGKIIGKFEKFGSGMIGKVMKWFMGDIKMPKIPDVPKVPKVAEEGILGKVISAYKIVKSRREEQERKAEIPAVAAINSAMRGRIDGRIEVEASPGAKVKKFEIDHSVSGDVGMNMVGAY